MKLKDDEIQVLGADVGCRKQKRKRILRWCVGSFMIVVVLFSIYSLYNKDRNVTSVLKETCSGKEEFFMQTNVREVAAIATCVSPSIFMFSDTVNDVPMQFFVLDGMAAQLFKGMPSIQDTTLLFVLPAADVRKDNREIVCDFVLDGHRYSKGKRKEGYCALLDGQLFLGTSTTDTLMNYCILHHGSFFRQYMLVSRGRICPNVLKGKSLRRAVAKKKGDSHVYIVLSWQRESLYDFSEALADYGMYNALYLPGGDAYAYYRMEGEVHFLGHSQAFVSSNSSYLVFRK